jgi:hypothetical protein
MKGPFLLALALAGTPSGEVRQTMRGNLAAVVALQPALASPAAFADPKNAPAITSSLATLARTRHKFPRPAAQEPAAAVAELFAEAVSRAQTDFAAGRAESARLRTRSATGLCLSCHSRQLSPADFAAAGKAADGVGLSPLERASFLAATRQFDAALAEWGDALSAPRRTDADAFEQTQALRGALSVAVRAKDDPATTVALLEARCASPELPAWGRKVCERQLADAKAWAAEGFTAARASAGALFERGQQLVQASAAEETLFPREEERVKVLRATAYFSLALEREPKAKWRGEALYLLGLATAATLDPTLWELDGIYLEACVRENPHTPLARRCAERFAERTVFDYSGSGGTRLPPDVAERLEGLRGLAR